jgi:hypothetical protein
VAAVKAANTRVKIRHLHYEPAAVNNVCTISEYAADGSTAKNVIKLKAGSSVADPVDRSYDPPKELNGLYLSVITAGTVYLEVETDPQPNES